MLQSNWGFDNNTCTYCLLIKLDIAYLVWVFLYLKWCASFIITVCSENNKHQIMEALLKLVVLVTYSIELLVSKMYKRRNNGDDPMVLWKKILYNIVPEPFKRDSFSFRITASDLSFPRYDGNNINADKTSFIKNENTDFLQQHMWCVTINITLLLWFNTLNKKSSRFFNFFFRKGGNMKGLDTTEVHHWVVCFPGLPVLCRHICHWDGWSLMFAKPLASLFKAGTNKESK